MTTLAADRISLDLDDLDDELSQAANDFDLGMAQMMASNGFGATEATFTAGGGGGDQSLTLESILNEEDDLENDEILKSLGESLTLMGRQQTTSYSTSPGGTTGIGGGGGGGETTASNSVDSRSSSMSLHVNQSLADKNGIVCKQAPLKQLSGQLISAIERADAGLPTAIAVAQLFAVGTSRGLILLFDSQQILKLYITTDHKDAITALALNNRFHNFLYIVWNQ